MTWEREPAPISLDDDFWSQLIRSAGDGVPRDCIPREALQRAEGVIGDFREVIDDLFPQEEENNPK